MKPTSEGKAKNARAATVFQLHSYFKLHLYIKLASIDAKTNVEKDSAQKIDSGPRNRGKPVYLTQH